MSIIDQYLGFLTTLETEGGGSVGSTGSMSSTMTFHMDSPHPSKKILKKRKREPIEEQRGVTFKKRLMVDFDNVIHEYKSWSGGKITGKLIPGAREFVEKMRTKYEIIIFTTRAAPDKGKPASQEQIKAVTNWLTEHNIYFDDITGEKWGAIAYIDDKAIRFQNNWNDVIKQVKELDS